MVSRRRLLLSGVTLVAAGCAAQPSPSTESTASTVSTAPPNRSTSALTPNCADAAVETPPKATPTADVTPPAYPSLPDALDTDTAAAFVAEYERAYALNELLATADGVNYVDIAVSDSPPITETKRGFVVDLAYTYAVEAETPADYPPRHVAYLVRPGVVARAELDADQSPTPFPVARAEVFRCEE